MIKVAYINDYPFSIGYGGKEVQMLLYKKFLENNENIKIKLIDWWDKNFLQDISLVHFFGHSNFRNLFKQVKQKGKKILQSPTIYHENDFRFSRLPYFLLDLFPVPNFYKNVKFEIENSDAVIVNSNAEKEYILKKITSKAKVHVIYNAIENNFNDIENAESKIFLEKYKLNTYEYILSVGMLDERKNSLLMIDSFLDVYNKINKKLVIVGDYRFSRIENFKKAQNLLEENKDKILHIKYIDRERDLNFLKSAYLNCCYHILPSFIETPGISNLEAMSYGKNIIVGICKPVLEYFDGNAIYCDPNNKNSIKNAILKADKLSYFNEEYVKFISEYYTYSKIIEKLKIVYSELNALA